MSEPTKAADSAAPAPATANPDINNPLTSALEAVAANPSMASTGDDYIEDMSKRLAAVLDPSAAAQPEPKPADPAPDKKDVGVDEDGLPLADPDAKPGPDGKDTPQSSWAKLRAKQEAAEKKAGEDEAKVAELEAKLKTPVIDPELKKRAELADQYAKELSLVKVEATEQYRQEVTVPAEGIVNRLDTIAKSYNPGLAAENFIAAFNIADPKERREKINTLTEDFDTVDQARVRTLAEDWYGILSKRDAIKANSESALAEARQLEEQGRLALTAREREAYKNSVSKPVETLKAALPTLALGDDESVQKALDKATASITADGFELDKPDVRAFAATSAAILPDLVAGLRARDARIKELEDTVSAYTKQSPRAASGSPVTTLPSATEMPAGTSLLDGIDARFAEFMRSNTR